MVRAPLRRRRWIGTGVQSGEIQHFWPSDKPLWLARYANALGIELSEVAAVGDSYGDVPMLAAVGRPFFIGADLPAEIAHAVHAPMRTARDCGPHSRALIAISGPRRS